MHRSFHFYLHNRLFLWLLIAAAVYLYGYVAKYLYGPFKIRQSQRQPGTVSYQGCELTELPGHVSPHFLQTVPPVAAAGFITLGCATRNIPANNLESYVSLWVNPKLQDTAQIITIVSRPVTGGIKIVNSIFLRTDFTNDTAIVTANSATGSVFPKDPDVAGIAVPALQDIGELYRLHRARVAYHRGNRKPTIAQFKDAPSHLQDEHHKTFERLLKAGYYDYDAASDEYIPTMRGAFLMTYKLLTPFKQIQRRRKKTAAEKEMRLVGYEMTAAPRA